MMILLQLAFLFLFLVIGEGVVALTGIPMPGCIAGMILLAFSLKFKLVKLNWIATVADFLCDNLGFFFIPAGVGVMKCFGLIQAEWIPIVMATILSTAVIILTTGWTHNLTHKLYRRNKHSNHD